MIRLLSFTTALGVVLVAFAGRTIVYASASPPAPAVITSLDGLGYIGDDGTRRVIAGSNPYLYQPPGTPSTIRDVMFDLDSGQTSPLVLPTHKSGDPCGVVAAGPGAVIAECYAPIGLSAFVGDYASHWVAVPSLEPVQTPSSDGQILVEGVGRYWIRLGVTGHEGAAMTTYVSIASLKRGAPVVRHESGDPVPPGTPGNLGPKVAADLNQPTLARAVCSPIARAPTTSDERDLLVADSYAPAGLFSHWVITQPSALNTFRPITVRVCGKAKRRVICDTKCGSYSLNRRWLSWAAASRVTLLNLKTNRQTTIETGAANAQPRVIGDHLLVTRPITGTPDVDYWGRATSVPSHFQELRLP